MKKMIGAGVGMSTMLLPLAAFADQVNSTAGVQTFLQQIQAILNILLPIIVTLALLAFFWGLVKFLWSAGDEKGREAGKGLMVWGVIALFVMVSVWGLVSVIGQFFGVSQGGTAPVPGVGAVGQ